MRLADGVLEVAVPDEGTPAYEDWQRTAPEDSYHTITFKVADLDRVREHLGTRRRGRAERHQHAPW